MANSHTVQQGESLSSIAKKFGFNSFKYIWMHSSNDDLREQRENPNILLPGDIVNIPDKPDDNSLQLETGKRHKIVVYKNQLDSVSFQLVNGSDEPFKVAEVELSINGEKVKLRTDDQGIVSIPLKELSSGEASLRIFANDRLALPQCDYVLQLSHLDPVQETSGIQARLNNLNHPCGEVDGILGEQTKSAVRSFQRQNELQDDGNPGPATQEKLVEVYGG